MARDYYGTLGVRQEATPEEIKRAYRKLARELHPDVNPDEGAQQRFREVTAAYEVLADPQKRKIVDMGGDPLEGVAGGGGGRDPFAGFGLGDIMDAFFGATAGGGGRGPRSRVQPGSDALIRMEMNLEDCLTGVSQRAHRRHGGPLRPVPGLGLFDGHPPDRVRHLRRARRDPVRAALVPRPGHDGAGVPGLPRLRRGHPGPVPPVQRRGQGQGKAHDHRQDPAGRRGGHAGPAVRPGRGRPRRWPGGRPVRRGRRGPAPHVRARRRRPALHACASR